MKVSFIDTNQNVESSYLPTMIAEALFQRMKQEELILNEVESTICQTKPDE